MAEAVSVLKEKGVIVSEQNKVYFVEMRIGMDNKASVLRGIAFAVIIIMAAVFIVPVIMTCYRSVGHYAELLLDCFALYPMFWNGIFYAAAISVLQMIVIIPCAFGMASYNFRGRQVLFFVYIMLMMMPFQVTMLPNYIGLREMKLLNTRAGIILPMVFSPFGLVVMYQYMKNINTSVIEALRLETKSLFTVLWHGAIPQIKSCIVAVFLFIFAESYNMLEQPLLFLKEGDKKNLTVLISEADKYSGEILFPAAVIYMLPIVFLFVFMAGDLEKGVSFGDF